MSNMPIMGHLVMGYPSLEQSYQNARTYAKAGFEILELQIPFSHPTADGTVITQANRIATEENHVSIEDCSSGLFKTQVFKTVLAISEQSNISFDLLIINFVLFLEVLGKKMKI